MTLKDRIIPVQAECKTCWKEMDKAELTNCIHVLSFRTFVKGGGGQKATIAKLRGREGDRTILVLCYFYKTQYYVEACFYGAPRTF